jgi:hypothetical protein
MISEKPHARVLELRYPKKRLRCVCGRQLQAYDFQLDPDMVRLICPECHVELFTIELAEAE